MTAHQSKRSLLTMAVVLGSIVAAASTPARAEPARSETFRIAANLDAPVIRQVTVKRLTAHAVRKVRFASAARPNPVAAVMNRIVRENWCPDGFCGARFALMIGIGY